MPYHARLSQESGLVRLRPAEADAKGPRRRRPHVPGAVERMRELYETTRLSTRAIGAHTGADAATVSRRARRHGWLRPDTGFPEEHYSAAGRRNSAAAPSPRRSCAKPSTSPSSARWTRAPAPASSERPSASSAPPAPSTKTSARSGGGDSDRHKEPGRSVARHRWSVRAPCARLAREAQAKSRRAAPHLTPRPGAGRARRGAG